jgi:hypothetical protein
MTTITVNADALIKVADVIDELVREVVTQHAELSKRAQQPERVVELLKVASEPSMATLNRALIRGGMDPHQAARLGADFRTNPDALIKFATSLLDNVFSHVPADGHGIPKSASETSASEGTPKGPYDC